MEQYIRMGKMHQESGYAAFDHVIVPHDADPVSVQNLLAQQVADLRVELAEVRQWLQNYEGRDDKYHSSYANVDWSRLSPSEQDHIDELAAKEIEKWNETKELLAEKHAGKIEKASSIAAKLEQMESRLLELRRKSAEATQKILQSDTSKDNRNERVGNYKKRKKKPERKRYQNGNNDQSQKPELHLVDEPQRIERYSFEYYEGLFESKVPPRAHEIQKGTLSNSTGYYRNGGKIDLNGYRNGDFEYVAFMLMGNIRNRTSKEDIQQLRWVALQIFDVLSEEEVVSEKNSENIRNISFLHKILHRIEEELRSFECTEQRAHALLGFGLDDAVKLDSHSFLVASSDELFAGNIRRGFSLAMHGRLLADALASRPDCPTEHASLRLLSDTVYALGCCHIKTQSGMEKMAGHDLDDARNAFKRIRFTNTPENERLESNINELFKRIADELRS